MKNKNRFIVILLFLINTNLCLCQEILKNEFIYDFLRPFSEGLCVAKKGDKYGFVNKKGEEVIPFLYDYALSFQEGLAAVKQGEEIFFIDKQGKFIFSYKYDLPIEGDGLSLERIGTFNNGWMEVMRYDENWQERQLWGIIDKTGKEIIPCGKYDSFEFLDEGWVRVRRGDWLGYIDRNGEEVIPLLYHFSNLGYLSEGLFYMYDELDQDFLLDQAKQDTGFFSEELIRIHDKWNRDLKQKRGFLNKELEVVIPCEDNCSSYYSYHEGMVIVQRFSQYGFMDKKGKIIIPFQYDEAQNFSEGLALVVQKGKYGYINKKGELIIPLIYDVANLAKIGTTSFREGMVIVMKDGKYGFRNTKGELIVPYQYDEVGRFQEGLAWVKQNDQYGFVNIKGELIVPCQYDSINSYSEGFAVVKKNDKWVVVGSVPNGAF